MEGGHLLKPVKAVSLACTKGWATLAQPVALAILLTALNATKPPHNDDFSYLTYAHEFAAHPTRPYNFLVGFLAALPANKLLMPPVLPAWLAFGISIFGDRLILLKLWLFPFAWLFTWAVANLFRRFTPSVASPLTWMTVLSPGILPSFNFMLEIPVLGLGLAAVALTIRACDSGRFAWILVAAILAGLSLETKYTAFAAVGAMILWCWQSRRPRFLMVVVIVSSAIFIGCETCIALQEGASHFLINADQRSGAFAQRAIHLVFPLIAIAGGLLAPVVLLGLAVLGNSARKLIATAAVVVISFFAVAILPGQWQAWGHSPHGEPLFTLVQSIDGVVGVALVVVVIMIVRQLRREAGSLENTDRFLLYWLLLEIAWYFIVTPFPAARRVLGISIVVTLLIGRLANRTCATGARRSWIHVSAALSVLLGLLFFTVDQNDARAAERAAQVAAHGPFRPAPHGRRWFIDQTGFGSDCLRAGLKPLILSRATASPGDVLFLVRTSGLIGLVSRQLDLQELGTIQVRDSLPLRTYPNFYTASAPLRHLDGPRCSVAAYRIIGAAIADPPAQSPGAR